MLLRSKVIPHHSPPTCSTHLQKRMAFSGIKGYLSQLMNLGHMITEFDAFHYRNASNSCASNYQAGLWEKITSISSGRCRVLYGC